MMDGMMAKARDAVGKNRDKIDKGVTKAAEMANRKTGGEHADKIDRLVGKSKDTLDRLDRDGNGEGRTER